MLLLEANCKGFVIASCSW